MLYVLVIKEPKYNDITKVKYGVYKMVQSWIRQNYESDLCKIAPTILLLELRLYFENYGSILQKCPQFRKLGAKPKMGRKKMFTL